MMRPRHPWLNLGKSVPCRRPGKYRGPAGLGMELMYLKHRKKTKDSTVSRERQGIGVLGL